MIITLYTAGTILQESKLLHLETAATNSFATIYG
jgi:hypothetical protein